MLSGFRFSRHLLRQILATIATSLLSLINGSVLSYSAVLLPQLKTDESFPYNVEYDSWIASIIPLAMAFGCLSAGPVMDKFGRKFSFNLILPLFIISWVIIAFAESNRLMLVGRCMTGLCVGAFRPMVMVFLSEVTDPQYRAMALVSTSLFMNFGALFCHVIGSYIYWRTCAFIFCVPLVMCLVIMMYLKESPLWVISKGETVTGTEIFYWYRTQSEAASAELGTILNNLKNKSENVDLKMLFRRTILSKAFLKGLIICLVLFIDMQFSGANMIQFYVLDLFKTAFSDHVDNFIVMIVADSVRIVGTSSVLVSVKYLPRRLIFLFSSFGTTLFIFILSICFYFNDPSIIWLSVSSMIIYIGISGSMVSTAWSFTSEVYPNNVRGLGSGITSTLSFLFLFIIVKITPSIINTFGISILYFGITIVTFVCSIILYFILPETNNKTLQEIEDNLNRNNKENATLSK